MKTLGLMTVAEAAEYLNVPRPTLYQHLREGNIPGIQIGGRWRIELSKLNEFIGNAKRTAPESNSQPQPYISSPLHSSTTPLGNQSLRRPTRMPEDVHTTPHAKLDALRSENERLRRLVADQLLEITNLRSASSVNATH